VNRFKNDLLAKRVREKRGDRTLRELAPELGISIATLSRIERGKFPDVYVLGELFNWLGDNPSAYFIIDRDDTTDVTVQLRAMQSMSAESAAAFMEVIRAAYIQVLDQASEDDKA
jgi:transcriptional regulator with XRE-family HTH domain